MANDAVLQVRIDAQLKSEVEQLYRQMGTTFSEAVRLFARQSLIKRRLPFDVSEANEGRQTHGVDVRGLQCASTDSASSNAKAPAQTDRSGFAMFSAYADDRLRADEKTAWQAAIAQKHANASERAHVAGRSPKGAAQA